MDEKLMKKSMIRKQEREEKGKNDKKAKRSEIHKRHFSAEGKTTTKKVKPYSNGKCLATKHDQTLFGDQTC